MQTALQRRNLPPASSWLLRAPARSSLSMLRGKKQTVASRSSTESEIVALDTALRIEGLPLLTFWGSVVAISKRATASCLSRCLGDLAAATRPALDAEKKRRPQTSPRPRAPSNSRGQLPRPAETASPAAPITCEGTVVHNPSDTQR